MATCAPVNRTLAGDLAPSAIIRELIFDDRAINVAFVVYHDNACTLFLPGGEIVRYDMVEHAITDRNGKAVAYKAYHKGERFVGVNARRDSSFTWVGDPRVAPDGGTVAYFAERPVRGGFGAAEYLLVIDGEVKDSCHEPGNIVFTPRGQLVFTVQDKRDSIVSIGGEVLGRFVAVSPPVVAPGTGDVFFWVRQNDRWCLYRNREPIDESESLVVDQQIGLRWDQEGRRVGYWVKRNGKWFVCVNGLATSALGLPLEFVGGPVFASDGGMAYSARVGDGAIAVVNGQRGELFDAVGQIVFSSDGKRCAHMAQRNGRQFVVLDGRSDTTFDMEYSAVYNQPGTMEDTPSFSPDGENLVYVVSNGGAQYVAVNDELRAGPYKYVSCAPAFAGDGKLIIFSAVLEPGYEMLIVGEEQIGPFQRIWWPKRQEFYSVRERPHLDSETGNLRFVGRDARTLALYEIAVGKH